MENMETIVTTDIAITIIRAASFGNFDFYKHKSLAFLQKFPHEPLQNIRNIIQFLLVLAECNYHARQI